MLPEAAESVEHHGSPSVREREAAATGERDAQRGAQLRQSRRRDQRFSAHTTNHTDQTERFDQNHFLVCPPVMTPINQ